MSVQVYSIPGETQGKRKAFLEWTSIDLSSKLSVTCEGNERLFLEGARRRATLWNYPQKHLVVIKDKKLYPFVKFKIIISLLCCLLDPLTNKHCKAWSSMINLWIDSKTCQKYRILLSGSQRSNNYLDLSEENVFENMMLSLWPCFTWKFFIIWFHKILKLIF